MKRIINELNEKFVINELNEKFVLENKEKEEDNFSKFIQDLNYSFKPYSFFFS